MRFEIGQQVWRASWDAVQSSVECPDCGGTGRLRVTFHDETQVSIGCQNCAAGYEPPTGRVKVYERKAMALRSIITGMEMDGERIRWRTSESYIVEDENLFDNEAAALARARQIAAAADVEERMRVLTKEKDTRTWAWNASYHRKQIKEAQRQIEYHTAKLNVAAIKAKEDKAA